MEDLIDVLTKTGQPTGDIAPKVQVHQKGLYHNTAHIWFYTADGDILLQQRSATKTICPLLWDVSVAGHVDAGETVRQAAVREIREEIGAHISETELQKIGVFQCFNSYPNGLLDNEFHHTFIAKTKVKIEDFLPQETEVEALKYVSIAQFHDILKSIGKNNHFVPTNKTYYQFVIDRIVQAIESNL